MSGNPALVLLVGLGLSFPATVSAQLTPPAGSAGAGNTPISGVPFGPANPSALSDPSGIGNASRIPPLSPNPPPPSYATGAVDAPARRSRAVTPYAAPRIYGARQAAPRKPVRGRPHVRTFTGICRGC